MLPLLIISFLSIFLSTTIFYRVLMFISIFMLPTTLMLLKSIPNYKQKKIQLNLLFMSLIILILSSARGDLCSLKFFLSM